jgi:hypothetical protein
MSNGFNGKQACKYTYFLAGEAHLQGMQELLQSGRWRQYTHAHAVGETPGTKDWRSSAWGIPGTEVPASKHPLGTLFLIIPGDHVQISN